ncbi:MAG: galactitol-1-phosphate 5-dehydrogenase [Dysgonamonadaceae bacterium]|jgi:L-iditol 2-dehydrogenase|nr:galactitol-1-phosphate 5-dehydrogenase [Dysgonamonadaceae bacterium]
MKANVLFGINDLRYVNVDRPVLKSDEVLVQVHAAGICGSDVARIFTSGTYHFPTIMGHEFSGEIVLTNVGDEYLQGKRVAVYPLIPCKQCNSCKQRKYELCSSYNYLGSRCNGGFAEYVAVPKWNLAFISDNISFEDAAMIEPAAVALHALCIAELKQGDTIAIIGPGTIGILLAQLSMIHGAGKVLLIGRSQQKLNFAKKMGIENSCNSTICNVPEWIAEQTDGKNADVVIEGTGAEASLVMALNMVKSSGVIIAMGNPVDDMHLPKIDYWKLLRKQLSIRGVWNSTYGTPESNWGRIISLIEEGKLKPSNLITHRLPLPDLLEGANMMRNKNIYTNKIMITL